MRVPPASIVLQSLSAASQRVASKEIGAVAIDFVRAAFFIKIGGQGPSDRFARHTRSQEPPPKRSSAKHHPHVSTVHILPQRKLHKTRNNGLKCWVAPCLQLPVRP